MSESRNSEPTVEARIRIPAPLRAFTGGAGEVEVEAGTVGDALAALGRHHQGILERILDGDGRLRGFVNVYLGDRDIRTLGGLGEPLAQGAEISIVPAVAGGRS